MRTAVDDKQHDHGTYSSINKYVGQIHDGGMYTYSDRDKNVGYFKDDKFHGHGTLTDTDDIKYVG